MLRGRHPSKHRRSVAIALTLLWLLGVEVLPNLHLAHHDDDHTHAADGAILAVRQGDHAHGHGHHHHHHHDHHADHADHADHVDHADHADHADAEEADAEEADAEDLVHPGLLVLGNEPPPEHAASGLAHRALALHQPPPPLLAPLHVPRASVWRTETPDDQLHATSIARPTARGPPAA